jgi:hypothetical protein
MTQTTTITRVTVRWDEQPGTEAGWYCESFAGSQFQDDSQKIWFPVAVDSFGADQAGGLREALVEAFPDAEIDFA